MTANEEHSTEGMKMYNTKQMFNEEKSKYKQLFC